MAPSMVPIGREWGQALQRGIKEKLNPIEVRMDSGQVAGRLATLNRALDKLDGRRVEFNVAGDFGIAFFEIIDLSAALGRIDGRSVRVNVHVDMAGAVAEVRALAALLDRLDGRTINIQFNADILAALARIEVMNREVTRLDGRRADVNVGVDIGAALAQIFTLKAAMLGLSAAGAPALAAIGAGVIGLSGPLAAAAVGFGGLAAVAIPSLMRIKQATQQQAQAQKSAGAAAGQAQSQAFAQAAAQQQLAQAVRNAAEQHRQALEQVRQAEDRVADAQRTAKQAQEDLTRARFEAARQLQDLSNSVKDGRLAERQAAFDVTDAERELAKVRADPKATKDQIARAQLAVDQAKQQQQEAHLRVVRLIADEKAAKKAGVEGSDQVRTAREKLAEANRRIAESERALSAAKASVAKADQQANDQITSARRALAQASQQASSSSAGLAGELIKLTPLEMKLASAWKGLTSAFTDWGKTLQPAVLPLFIKGISLLKSVLPALTPIVRGAASGVGTLLNGLAAAGKSPFFKNFAAFLGRSAGPAIVGFGKLAGNLIVGLAGIAQAFAPIGFAFLGVLNQMASAFAKFATGLINNPGFQAFSKQAIALLGTFVQQWAERFALILPLVGQIFGALMPAVNAFVQAIHPIITTLVPVAALLIGAIGQIVKALAPLLVVLGQFIASLLTGLMPILTPIVNGIAKVATVIVQALIRALRACMPALQQIIISVASLLPELLPLVDLFGQLVAAILPVLPPVVKLAAVIIQALVPVLRVAIQVIVLYWTMIVNLLLPVIRALVGVVTWAAGVLQPVFVALGVAFVAVGKAATWLWNNAIGPAFRGIATVAQWLYSVVAVVLLAPFLLAFKLMAAVVTWWWKNVIAPAWGAVGRLISAAWTGVIRPVLVTASNFLRNTFAPVFTWLRDKIIKPVWSAISAAVKFAWEHGISQTFNALKSGVGKLGGAFKTGVDAIRIAWDKVRDAAKKPIAFVVNTVFNGGIVKIWNAVAKLVPGVKQLDPITGFARGGVLPGFSPGRDSLLAAVSPGESIFRPEFTRAVGPQWVHQANLVARRAGVTGVQHWLTGADHLAGEGLTFAHGGTVPYAGEFGIGGIVGGFLKAAKGFFADGLVKVATRAFNPLINRAQQAIGGTAFGDLAVGTVRGLVGKVLGFFKPLESKIGGGPGAAKGLAWARGEAGKPYIWGGVGPTGYDCSGFMSAITNVIHGESPHSRLFSTRSFGADGGPGGFVRDLASGFKVGVTNAGVGHMAGTLGKVNVESSGSAGVRVGGGARGWNDGLFTHHYGLKFADGGTVPAYLFDDGGWLPPGVSTVVNGTGRPEPVLTHSQLSSINAAARGDRTVTGMAVEKMYVQDPVDVDMMMRRADFATRSASFG